MGTNDQDAQIVAQHPGFFGVRHQSACTGGLELGSEWRSEEEEEESEAAKRPAHWWPG
jgi:hypothetical protein